VWYIFDPGWILYLRGQAGLPPVKHGPQAAPGIQAFLFALVEIRRATDYAWDE
jgi:hypothetical protein